MASKKRNKKRTRDDRTVVEMAKGVRNWTAVAAFQRSGGGTHQDGRTRRRRTRNAQKRAALAEYQ